MVEIKLHIPILNGKNNFLAKMCVFFLKNVCFSTVCVGEWKYQNILNLYFFENQSNHITYTQFLGISIGSSPPWH